METSSFDAIANKETPNNRLESDRQPAHCARRLRPLSLLNRYANNNGLFHNAHSDVETAESVPLMRPINPNEGSLIHA